MNFNYVLGNNSSNNKTVSSRFSPNLIFKRILFELLNICLISAEKIKAEEDNLSHICHDNYISDLAKQLFHLETWKDLMIFQRPLEYK